jgi:hypothetical protein
MSQRTFVAALIGREDYEAFRRFPGMDWPDTYDEWLQLFDQDCKQRAFAGQMVQQIQVHPDEFARYLDALKETANWASLTKFARDKAMDKSY